MAKEKTKGKSVHVESETNGARDEIISSLVDEINKANKDKGKTAYLLDEQEDPSTISDWISTGSSILDLAISNRPDGGLPVGRMVEFTGLEGTGKSLVSAHIMANTQKKGGVAVYIDTEASVSTEFWKSIGVDVKNVVYLATETVEDIFDNIERAISYIRKNQPDKLVTIIVDSVAGATTKSELESEHGKTGYATDKSIIISKAMRKITTMLGKQKILIIFTNQLRQNLNAMAFGDKYVVSGGKALAYHTSVRVRLNNMGKLKKGEEIIGNECKAVVIKNRMGPPNRQASFNIYYDSGIADYSSWLDILKKIGAIKQAGAYYKYEDETQGGEQQFQSKDFVNMMQTNKELRDKFYQKICDACIMKYKNPNSVIVDDATVDTNEDEGKSEENA
jgi:recombination protein RecA